ncbi:MAG: group II truncated hemoglobin [Casimicrobiaceae bacterium]
MSPAVPDALQPMEPATPYAMLGGDEGVRALVERFYDLMELDLAYAGIRALHPERLDGSREKLYLFLCGWLGGPQRYVERHGHPRLRARHLPFAIATAERDQWLACMRQALHDTDVPGPLARRLLDAFFQTADFMRNRMDATGAG